MDFIERLLGIAPDGGSGSLELLLLLAPIVGIALLKCVRRERRRAVPRRG
jgi:hypothetical protein